VCAAAGACAAGGYYTDGSANNRAFVVNSTAPCVVPKLVGKTLSAAKKALAAASCSVGKVSMVYASAKKGRVAAQKPKPGTHLRPGAKVALTVSKGKK
jgi:beta-lactam-binding protein with PASTA domain